MIEQCLEAKNIELINKVSPKRFMLCSEKRIVLIATTQHN